MSKNTGGALQVIFDSNNPTKNGNAGDDGVPGEIGTRGRKITSVDNLNVGQNGEGIFPTQVGTQSKALLVGRNQMEENNAYKGLITRTSNPPKQTDSLGAWLRV